MNFRRENIDARIITQFAVTTMRTISQVLIVVRGYKSWEQMTTDFGIKSEMRI